VQAGRHEAMLKPVDEPLIGGLKLEAPCRIADVGCGGGETTREILRRAPEGSSVHGFDISAELVELARGRTPPGERAIAFDVADVSTAGPDQAYDRLASRFGIMFYDEPRAAFTNLVRWLAPGGRLAFAVWGAPSENPWMTTVRDVVATIVDLPPSDPDAPGPFRYGDANKLLDLLGGAGVGDLHVEEWRRELAVGGGLPSAEAAHFAIAAFSTFGELLAEAGDEALASARRSLAARFSQYEVKGGVKMDACVRIITGTRVK
jgi:SAM-dependent methyltransferase